MSIPFSSPWRGRAGSFPACAAAFLLLCAGCGTPAVTIQTRKDVALPVKPSPSLFVVSHIARIDPEWAEAFAASMKASLERYGIKHEVQSRSPLSVQSDRSAYADAMAKFGADAWLVVEPGDATVDRDGRNLSRRFEAGLFRYGQQKKDRLLVWRASILVQPGGAFVSASDMDELARDLVKKLRTDGIIGPPPRPAGATESRDAGYPVGGNLKQE